jgi:hypothetical protein
MKSTPQSRRRHLLWRQTAVYGTLTAAVVFVAVMAVGMWRGDLDPVLQTDFKVKPSETADPLPIPCPAGPDAAYLQPSAVVVQVLNGSGQTGAAQAAAAVLAGHGFPSPQFGNGSPYDGIVMVVSGVTGVNGAYTVLQFAPEGSVVVLDRREDATVDLILGSRYKELPGEDAITYDPAAVIEPQEGCREASVLLEILPTPKPEADQEEPEEGAPEEGAAEVAAPAKNGRVQGRQGG